MCAGYRLIALTNNENELIHCYFVSILEIIALNVKKNWMEFIRKTLNTAHKNNQAQNLLNTMQRLNHVFFFNFVHTALRSMCQTNFMRLSEFAYDHNSSTFTHRSIYIVFHHASFST